MFTNPARPARTGLRLTLATLALGLLAPVSRAGGPILINSPADGGAPPWQGTPPTAAMTIDTGPLGILNNATARALVIDTGARWTSIPSSSITVTTAPNVADFNLANTVDPMTMMPLYNVFALYASPSPVGFSAVIFDNEDANANNHGDIFDALGFPPGVLGVASPTWVVGGEIIEGVAMFNARAVHPSDTTGTAFQGVMTHELGHFLNLAHSVVNGQAIFFGVSDIHFPDGTFMSGLAVTDIESMFPFLNVTPGSGTGEAQTSPHADEVFIASTLYPEPANPLSNFGSIRGTLFDTDGTTPRTGGQIIVRRLLSPFTQAVSAISGDFLQADTAGHPLRGTYAFNTLVPGVGYSLEVRDSLMGGFSTPVFVPPGGSAAVSLGPLPGPEEFYSGGTETNFEPDDSSVSPAIPAVPQPGGPAAAITANIILNASTACTPAITNPGFETGGLSGWVVQDIASPFIPLQTAGFGSTAPGGHGFFTLRPPEGARAAVHGFDGAGPGTIRLAQDINLAADVTALRFDYRAAWNLTINTPTLPRTFNVSIQPSGGGAPLQVFNILTAAAGTVNLDTGNRVGEVDLSAFAGTSVRIAFEWGIPETAKGPGFFQLDKVRLLCPVSPCCPGDANNSGGAVNANDFLAVQANFGANNGVGGLGDADCSGGAVNANDFLAVQGNFGASC